jgi:acylpyruvate hydrolase
MKIFCIGRNYAEHARELNNPLPEKPIIFMKPNTAILAEGKDFYIPDFSNDIHYELEVVLKICKNGKSIQPAFADTYFEEIGLGIDFTARDIQQKCKEKGHPWELAKAFDYSAALGDFVPKSDLDISNIQFKLLKNNQIMQDGNTADMIFDFNFLICYISQFFTLQKGDLIYTGTPAGVGRVEAGDLLEGFVGNDKLLHCRIR